MNEMVKDREHDKHGEGGGVGVRKRERIGQFVS